MKRNFIYFKDFNKKFRKEYKKMYDAGESNMILPCSGDAVAAFDAFLSDNEQPNFKVFVASWAKLAVDWISSDRECAAFMAAVEYFAICLCRGCEEFELTIDFLSDFLKSVFIVSKDEVVIK